MGRCKKMLATLAISVFCFSAGACAQTESSIQSIHDGVDDNSRCGHWVRFVNISGMFLYSYTFCNEGLRPAINITL